MRQMYRWLDAIFHTIPTFMIAGITFATWWQHPQLTEMQVFQLMLGKYWVPILLAIVVQIVFLRKAGKGN